MEYHAGKDVGASVCSEKKVRMRTAIWQALRVGAKPLLWVGNVVVALRQSSRLERQLTAQGKHHWEVAQHKTSTFNEW